MTYNFVRCLSSSALFAAMLVAATTSAQASVEISANPTKNMNCSAGVCTPTAKNADLNATELANMLATGDVKVTTGSGTTNIVVKDTLGWTSTSRLTLDAIQSIEIDKPVMVTGTGAVTVTTNDGGTGGDLIFGKKGNATFWDLNSNLVINGQSYVLVGDIATLAADIAANPSGFYALASSIDLTGAEFETVPIPTEYLGTFEGLGHNIRKLNVTHSVECTIDPGYRTTTRCAAFFANIGSGAVVRDVTLDQAKVLTNDGVTYAGVLAAISRGEIWNVQVSGSVKGAAPIMGGLVGDDGCCHSAGIWYSSAAVDVTYTGEGRATLGGLVAVCCESSGVVAKSHATGRVDGGPWGTVGGLVGSAYNVFASYATGSVRGWIVGGLIGTGVIISRSFAVGSVTGTGDYAIAGGLIGQGMDVRDSYALGNLEAIGQHIAAGGLYGEFYSFGGDDYTSYSIGAVDGRGKVGGFLGRYPHHYAHISELPVGYWDLDTSGLSHGCGEIKRKCENITGLTDAQLKSQLPTGFDPTVWGQSASINNGYPYLLTNPPPQ